MGRLCNFHVRFIYLTKTLMQSQKTDLSFIGAGLALAALGALVLYAPPAQAHEGHDHAEMGVETNADVSAEVGASIRVQERQKAQEEHLEAVRSQMEAREAARVEANAQLKATFEEREAQHEQWREARQAELEERQAALRARFEERREEISARINEQVLRIVERIELRFVAAVARLEGIADRLESRIAKFEERGSDVTEATEALAQARSDLALATELTADLSASLDSSLASATPRENFAKARIAMSDIKNVLRQVHGHLRDAVVALRGGVDTSGDTEASAEVE